MAIDLITTNERIAIDVYGVRFWGSRATSKEQASVERICTSKKGVTDYHKMTDELLKRKITGWEPNPDPVCEHGQPVPFSVERLLNLPLDVKNEIVGQLYEASGDLVGNSKGGSKGGTPPEGSPAENAEPDA